MGNVVRLKMEKKKENIFYRDIELSKRVKLKQAILEQRANIIKQRDLLENSLMKSLRSRITIIDDFLKGNITLEHYVKTEKQLGIYMLKFFENKHERGVKDK